MSTTPPRKIFSLSQVAASIKKTLAERYSQAYWIKADMNKLNFYRHSGHCYPDLVEKKDNKIIAEMRGMLWKGDYQAINRRFLDTVNEPLKDGISILFLARISYDALYGIGLQIIDIDPTFSLGELTREKLVTIGRLKQEKLFDLNRSLPFPLLPKRLAIISVETSKGLADFFKIIENNPWAYRFEYRLFPALLQGDKAVDSIRKQLRVIGARQQEFDALTIIRGGGGDVGLSCYNDYRLASELARFPIPVLTGIGHATNETISEMVAYKNAITPSELADFLIQHFHQFAAPVVEAEKLLKRIPLEYLSEKTREMAQLSRQFQLASLGLIREQNAELRHLGNNLRLHTDQFFKSAWSNLLNTEQHLEILHPDQVLKRGFTINYQQGKVIKSVSDVDKTQEITTVFSDGKVISSINKILTQES
jgi:exodeoxyribonuclease VII large subunit